VIEAVCDNATWTFQILAGSPGSLNDINVLYQSPLYMDVITGKWPPRDCPLTVNVWGKPPDRGDTTPRHEPGTGREQSRNTPLGG